jgi:hypothetical protein
LLLAEREERKWLWYLEEENGEVVLSFDGLSKVCVQRGTDS